MPKGHTFKLFFQTTTTSYAEGAYELLEVNLTALVCVEDIEDIVSKLCRLAEGEELLVYPTELGLVEMSRGAVFLETLVPKRSILCVARANVNEGRS